MDKEQFLQQLNDNAKHLFCKTYEGASSFEKYAALSRTVMNSLTDSWMETREKTKKMRNEYYFSAEFLVGRALGNNLLNLGILSEVKDLLKDIGVDFEQLEDEEDDAALGNGGLGRLAACFMDSAATEGYPVQGYGVRYSQGLFEQKFIDGFQREEGDDWTKKGDFWSLRCEEDAIIVRFRDEAVLAVPYDMPVIGYKNGMVNTLRLWQA